MICSVPPQPAKRLDNLSYSLPAMVRGLIQNLLGTPEDRQIQMGSLRSGLRQPIIRSSSGLYRSFISTIGPQCPHNEHRSRCRDLFFARQGPLRETRQGLPQNVSDKGLQGFVIRYCLGNARVDHGIWLQCDEGRLSTASISRIVFLCLLHRAESGGWRERRECFRTGAITAAERCFRAMVLALLLRTPEWNFMARILYNVFKALLDSRALR